MKPEGRLVVMVGLPRSGKTTVVNQKFRSRGWAVVCPDLVRIAIHGQRFVGSAEPFVWATVYAAVDALILAGCNVVVDGCFNTRKRREDWIKRKARFYVINTPSDICKKRAIDIGDTEIIPVIERMASEFQPLSAEELMGHDMQDLSELLNGTEETTA